MNSPANQQPNQLNQASTAGAEYVLWLDILVLLVAIVSSGFYFYLYLDSNQWQLLGASGAPLIILVAGSISLWLIRRDRPLLGAQILVYGFGATLLTITLFVADFGLLFGSLVVIVTLLIAHYALPAKLAIPAILVNSVLAFVMLALDFVQPGYRATVEALQTYIPVTVGLFVLGFGVFVVLQFRHYRLRTKLIVTFIAVTLISVGAVAYITNRASEDALTQAANQRLLAAAEQSANTLDAFIDDNLQAIRTESELPALSEFVALTPEERTRNSLLRQEVVAILRSLQRRNLVFIDSYALLDKDGINILDTSAELVGNDESDRDYFQVPSTIRVSSHVSPIVFEKETGEPFLYFSSAVLDSSRNIIGVLRVRYKAEILQEFMKDASSEKEILFGVIFDENHLHLAHATEPEALYELVGAPDPKLAAALQAEYRLPDRPVDELFTNLPQLEENLINASIDPFFTATDVATGDKINQVAAATMNSQPWVITFFQPQEVFLAPVQEQTRNTVLATAGILALVAMIAVVLGQRLSKPIVDLTNVAQQVTSGNLKAGASVDTEDEIGQLAQAFNSMTTQLRNLIGSLEEQVQDRTAELALTIEVGQKAAAFRNLNELLPTITEFIRERFDLYYVHVYFIDDLGQNLTIKSGTGEVGRQLLAHRHSLPVGPGSIVGQVAASGQPIVVSDTETSDIHRPNPLLPRTRSELAVPLVVEGRVIGVLDMQATKENTFTANNLPVFEALATQLAISIDSAQQWAAAQEAQHKTEQALKQLTQEVWAEALASRKEKLGFVYDLSSVDSLAPESADNEPNGALSVPLVIQNQSIGQLSVESPPDKIWTEEERVFLETVAQQLAQKAETLRLFEGTQKQAAREQVTRQITDKIRASRNIESALKTAAEELSKVLGTAGAAVELKASSPGDQEIK